MTYIECMSIFGAVMGETFIGFVIGLLFRIDYRIKKIMDELKIKENE